GTVIDHIRPGQAPRIMHLLKVLESKNKVTMGLNLPSKLISLKDLLKIENRVLTNDEANEVVIFAPEATINIIKDFEVIQKMTTHFPRTIENIFLCANPACITHNEPVKSLFNIEDQGKRIKLTCHYCEKSFDRDQVKVKI
ncbi:MAG: pyrI, partial [Gammaproteobacteria bacterium]|nr:pyrI [Gammaproteobacteria bacterium]